jgi:FkbM family methyltransferase
VLVKPLRAANDTAHEHQAGNQMSNHTLKRHALPWATRLFASPGLRRLPPLLEMTGAALQSKRGGGYAAIWQEIEGALNFITTPAPVIFDVGANVGNWTSSLLEALPATRKVFMFEPQPSCWVSLEKICSDKTHLEKKAASDTSGTLIFWANSNTEISSFYEKAGGGHASCQISVEAITIDDFIAENRIEIVDYVKIDVEGHELSVIKGARRAIQQGTINAFSFEFGQADVASRTFFADFWECLTSLNLRIYRLGHDGYAIHIPRYSYDLECFAGVANYVASVHQPKRWR